MKKLVLLAAVTAQSPGSVYTAAVERPPPQVVPQSRANSVNYDGFSGRFYAAHLISSHRERNHENTHTLYCCELGLQSMNLWKEEVQLLRHRV